MSGETRAYDVIIIGAGTAGITAAVFAAEKGLRVLLLEQASEIGGALLINRGQMSAAGTKLQREKGIDDTVEKHLADIERLSRGTADMVFARMAVERQGPFIDWLMAQGFEMIADMPRIIYGQEAYETPRTYWGKDDGFSILAILRKSLEPHIANGQVTLRTGVKVERLVQAKDDRVTGVVLDDGTSASAKAVLLATGGYGANRALFARLHPGHVLWPGAWLYADGSGIEMGVAAGGVIDHADTYFPNFGGVLDHTLDQPRYRSMGGLVPQDREIWEIVVNLDGERFYAEDLGSVDQRAKALAEQPEGRAFVIFDQSIRDRAPNLFHYFNKEKTARFYDENPGVARAESLAELAAKTGIEREGLARTVAAYNAAQAAGGGDPLGRLFMPAPIQSPPFYAVAIHAYSVRSFAGLKVDTHFRVIDAQAQPIAGLYAVGEVLGNFIVRYGSAGGMSLTPALVFGRMLGEEILPRVLSEMTENLSRSA
jgi:fumarate reductase flavoprotein subunit